MDGTIRLARACDAGQIQAIYAPFVEATPISFEYDVPSVDEMCHRIEAYMANYPWLVFECGDVIAGYAYGSQHRTRAAYQWSVDVSVYVHPEWQRRKVARALYTSLLAILAMQGYYNAFAGITLPNAASVGFHEAMGFEPIGVYRAVGFKMGAWYDVGWWQRVLREAAGEPAPPLTLAQVMAMQGFEGAMGAGTRVEIAQG